MSLKSLIQVIIVLIILIILGGVYFNYFSKYNDLSLQEKEEEITNKIDKNLIKKKEDETVEVKLKTSKEEAKVESEKPKEEAKIELEVSKKEAKVKKAKITNLVKDVEYLTTDKNGNKYKILAKSGRTNIDNKNILDLDNVRGFITSIERSPIYIVSDFAEYNSSNLNSNFYQNVVINYEDKEITCDNFEIDMKTNIAVAYSNVVVTDPKSIMKAGIITLDIETKVININPDNKKNKVTVTTN